MPVQHKFWSLFLTFVNLKLTHWSALWGETMKITGALNADSCDFCPAQTPLRLNHRESSMLLCLTRDTTFSCRWATSSLPSFSWHSSSSSSSSSLADVEPKVWPAIPLSAFRWSELEICISVSHLDFLCFQSFIQRCPWGEREHTSTHIHTHNLTFKHTLRCLSSWHRSSRSQSSSEEFEMDVAEVTVCSQDERRFGELDAGVQCKHIRALLSTVCVFWLSPHVALDYKNNLLKEKVHMNTQPKVIDLDKGNTCTCKVSYQGFPHFPPSLTSICLLSEMQKFSKWGNDKWKLESLAGPEAAL